MAGITAAGSASGMDFESIIAASLQAKKAQLDKQTTTKKEETNILLSGVGKLSSALETFKKSIEALTKDNGFNVRKVTTDQPTENPFFSIETKDDASNGNYDITVKQLATTEKVEKKFADDTKFAGGKLTITLPPLKKDESDPTSGEIERTFTIDIEDGATLDQIRKQINKNDIGVTASIVRTKDGDKLVIDSGVSGEASAGVDNLKIEYTKTANSSTHTDGSVFNYSTTGGNGAWDKVTKGQNAIIDVDGEELQSKTNKFSNQISGLTINVHRLSEKDDEGGFKSNNAKVEQDNDAVAKKMQDFIAAYNGLQDTLDGLYKHNTYTDGKNNYDGGEMAGDSMLRSLRDQLQQMMTSFGRPDENSSLDIYSLGMEVDKEGKFKLDSTEFKEGLESNFNGVVNLFSGEDGILTKLNTTVESYTKSNGIIDTREEELNALIKQYEQKEADNAAYLEKYEQSLRQKYARLDTTIAGYNNSLMYLQSALV